MSYALQATAGREKDLKSPLGANFGSATRRPPNKPFALMGLQTSPLAGRATAAGGKGTGGPSYTCSSWLLHAPPANEDLRGAKLT